ncbi:hypothetical protein DEHRE_12870 [Dehalobacter restrictus DSM 9455]|uniref:Uncharacterized protein n=1 Tax=Dehalobacter restrictus (strain DSM 9455 / PER-K23) TaxID=871738 RepID=A0ABM5PBB6_DEHRP|nr:hypothetical protein DEHRE_12870 [Dehalobacter restrictus DSM 9455]
MFPLSELVAFFQGFTLKLGLHFFEKGQNILV